MSTKVHKLEYEDLNGFTPEEMQLVVRHAAIFSSKDAPPCPKCGREKSPRGKLMGGPCLYCIEEKLKQRKTIMLKHLPDLWPADGHLIQLAHELIEKHRPGIREAKIAYLMRAKHAEKGGKVVLGSCAKQSPKNKLLHGWDFIVEIAWDMWALFGDREREALLLHELCHIAREDGVWKIQPHSVEEHVEVVGAYGLWKPDLLAFAAVIREVEEGDNDQMPLPLATAVQGIVDTMNEGDSIQVAGAGITTPKLVKRNGKMVAEDEA